MAAVSDTIAATVTLKADGAIKDLNTLSRKAKETDRAFNDASRSTQASTAKVATGVNRASGAATKSSTAFGQMRQSVVSTSSALGILGVATGVFTTATAGIFSAANAASRLNQQVSASKQTFGAAAESVRDFSRTSATGIGVAAADALKASSRFGAFAKQAGFSQSAAAKMSTTLVQLGGDLASFKDVSVQDALDAIASGLAGESEPLRRLGVDLRQTKVDAEALASGFATTKDSISETDRVAARYVSLLRQTRDAQGDAARTGNEYANTQRRASASFEEFKAAGGQVALPGITDTLEGLTKVSSTLARVNTEGDGVLDTLSRFGAKVGFGSVVGVFGQLAGGAEEAGDKVAAAAKIYDSAIGKFGDKSPEATAAMNALRREVDLAEKAATRSGQAFESTARATARVREETAAAAGTLRGFVDAQRGVQDATERVAESRTSLEDAERKLSDLRRQGKVDAEAVADAELRVQDASRSTADARQRVTDTERKLADLRRSGPVDAERVADAEQSVQDATRGVTSARRALIDAETEIARLRAGPTGEESTDASRDITRAEIDLERAKQRLRDAKTALGQPGDKADARLDIRDAELALAEATDNLRDAQAAQIALQTRGISGSKELREAEERAQDARLQLADATRRQSEAEADARSARAGDPEFAEKIAALTRDVDAARRGVTSAIRDENEAASDLRTARAGDPEFERNLAGAVRAVEGATRDLERAQQDLPFAADAARRAQEGIRSSMNDGSDSAYRLWQALRLVNEQYAVMAGADPRNPQNFGFMPGFNSDRPTAGRAMGGPVMRGTPYIVGERRPELFIPNQSGRIAPRVPTSSGGANVSINLVAPHEAGVAAQVEYAGRVVGWQLDRSGRR